MTFGPDTTENLSLPSVYLFIFFLKSTQCLHTLTQDTHSCQAITQRHKQHHKVMNVTQQLLQEVMIPVEDLVTITEQDDIETALCKLAKNNLSSVPVVREQQVLAFIDVLALLAYLVKGRKTKTKTKTNKQTNKKKTY